MKHKPISFWTHCLFVNDRFNKSDSMKFKQGVFNKMVDFAS